MPPFASATCSRSARAKSKPHAPSSARCARTSIRSSASARAHSPSPKRSCARRTSSSSKQNRIKSDFISIAAHELRTPLTSIVGYLDLFSEGRFGELPR